MNLAHELNHFLDVQLPLLAAAEKTEFDRLAGPSQGVVIYGCGKLGRKIAAGLERAGEPATAFADANQSQWGTRQNGLEVLSPRDAAREFGLSHIFAVTVWRDYPMIKETLMKAGAKRVAHFLSLLWKYSAELLPNYNLDLPSRMLAERPRIEQAFQLLQDDLSQSEFLYQLNWMTSLRTTAVPRWLDGRDQYFPEELFQLGRHEVFIDCGAYDGDTLKVFLERIDSHFDGVVAIEPDPKNVQALESLIAFLDPALQHKIVINPFGAGARNETAAFAASGSESSAIHQSGESTVEVRRIDDMLVSTRPTYIKMDIEGAELEALNGAEATIQKYCPKLAVCVYHLQEHLWEIPLRINQLQASYRLFLRRHRDEFGDVVCYALP